MKELDKKLIRDLKNRKGEVRGVTLKTDAEFIKKKYGARAVKKIEKALQEAGAPLVYSKIRPIDFYPIGLRALSLIAARELLGFSEEKVEEMGREAPKHSWIIRIFARFFFSVEKTAAQAGEMWGKHYTVGQLSAEADEKNRVVTIKLKELDLHPLFCLYLKGYFGAILRMTLDSEVNIKRTKCPFDRKEDSWHEYRVTW